MNILSWIILIVISIWFIFAILHMKKNKGCCGQCKNCNMNCSTCNLYLNDNAEELERKKGE